MSVRIATFNVENLFARYNFKKEIDPTKSDGFQINDLAFDIYNNVEKTITSKAIKEVGADIICFQEVESLTVLDRFCSKYLSTMKYKHRMIIDGNDPRQIDVAILSRYPFDWLKSHRQETKKNNSKLFSRDCLEAVVYVNGKQIHFYVNHFKSMIGGRAETYAKRFEQANRVIEIIEQDWKAKNYEGNFIVCGDFNDYIDNDSSIVKLAHHKGVENVVERLPKDEQWTHYYSGNEYTQLDYLLPSVTLAKNNLGTKPQIMRKGLPLRAGRYTGKRFDGIGKDNPKASDHCPVFMDFELL